MYDNEINKLIIDVDLSGERVNSKDKMRKVLGKGINFAAQINPSRSNIGSYQVI